MSNALRVMTYNICDGGGDRAPLILEAIRSANPDVVVLNEADEEQVVRTLADALGMAFICAHGSGNKHIALLSRLQVVEWQIYNRRPITQALLEVELESETGIHFRIYGVHLLPYFMLLPYEVARRRTVKAILKVVQAHAQQPHLIIGDFNAVTAGESVDYAIFPKKIHRLMLLQANRMAHLALGPLGRAGYTDVFRKLHPHDEGKTWIPTHLSARLDYIFADAPMLARLKACEVVTAPPAERASDHYPLAATFNF